MSGAFGSIKHPNQIMEFTLKDLSNLIRCACNSQLFGLSEKTDGHNMFFSVIDDRVRFARNKSHLKNYGLNAMAYNDLSDKYPNDNGDAYMSALAQLQRMVDSLSSYDRSFLFSDGKMWYSIEIISPNTKNIIHYEKSYIVIHGSFLCDMDGNFITEMDSSNAMVFLNFFDNISNNEMFAVQTTQPVFIDGINNANIKAKHYIEVLKRILMIRDDQTLQDFKNKEWIKIINYRYLDDRSLEPYLLHRWSYGNKSNNIRKVLSEATKSDKKWAMKIDKDHSEINKNILSGLEMFFIDFGDKIISNLKNTMVLIPETAIKKTKKDLKRLHNKILKSNDHDIISKYYHLKNKHKAVGGAINATEGITFYGSSLNNNSLHFLKLTGSFTIINEMLNLERKL